MRSLLLLSFLFGLAGSAQAAARPGRPSERKTLKADDRRAEGRGDELKVTALVEKHEVVADRPAAESALRALGSLGRSRDAARVVAFVFGVSGGKFAARGEGELSPAGVEAIARLDPRSTAARLHADGVGREDALVVLNRLELLKTDPHALRANDLAARANAPDQKLSATQLAWNEGVADAVYSAAK